MKKGLLVALILIAVLACPFLKGYAAEEGAVSGAPGAQVRTGKTELPPGPGAVAPPQRDGASGRWVEVPAESVGGRWVPRHAVWVGANPAPAGYVRYYGPAPAYVIVPPPPPTFAGVLADLFVMRPLGIAGLALGTGATIVATPFAIPSGSMGEVSRDLIGGPFDFTFRRPLGVW